MGNNRVSVPAQDLQERRCPPPAILREPGKWRQPGRQPPGRRTGSRFLAREESSVFLASQPRKHMGRLP
eukprot:16443091-Heterocapsa_arctica.AAC.1